MMPDGAVVDTDVLLKFSAYRLAADLLAVLAPFGVPAALGLTHLIAPSQLRGSRQVIDKDRAAEELARLLAGLATLEPSGDELDLAALIEDEAQARDLPLDRGESQLLAVTLARRLPLMLTGDRRAIAAVESVLGAMGRGGACARRIACLEQAVLAVLRRRDGVGVRARVCAEAGADKTLALCFSCGSPAYDPASASVGLASHIGAVRRSSGGALVNPDDLLALAQEDGVRGG